MSNDLNGAGGTPENAASGASDDGSNEKDVVSYATHKRLLEQRKNTQRENEELKAKLAEFETAQKAAEDSKLAQQGEYKKLLEQREKELNDLRGKHSKLETTIVNDYKLRAFESHLPGKIKNDKYLRFVNLDAIAINPESGEVDEESVKSTVAEYVKEHGDLIARIDAPKLPAGTPQLGLTLDKAIGSMNYSEKKEELKKQIAAILPQLTKKQ